MLKSIVGGCVRLVLAAGMALAVGAVVTVPTGTVMAQPGGMGGGMMGMFGGMGGRGGMDPTYTSRDLDRAGQMLGFDAAQKEAAKTFLDSYQTAFTEESAKFQKVMEKAREAFREDQDPSAWDGVRKAGEELAAARKKLDAEFVDNLKALSTEEQKAKWPKFERTQRREAGLDRGSFLSGERVNLVTIVEKMELTSEAKAGLGSVLEQYEVDLDRELVNRQKVQEELQADAQKLFGNMRGLRDVQNLDTGKIDELISKGREASVRVRDVNNRFAKQIEGMLPTDAKAGFAEEVKKASFPDVYRQTRTARSLEAAMGFGDLTADQKTQIEALKSKYAADLVPLNEKLSEAQQKNEMEMNAERMMNWMGNQDDPVREMRQKKRDLGRSVDDSLKAILSEEQVKRLPTDDGGDDRPGRRMREGGGGGGGGGGDAGPRRPNRGGGGGGAGGGGGGGGGGI